MTLHEFEAIYENIYEFMVADDTDSMYQVIITSNKSNGVFNNNLILLFENDTFHIYTEFTYEEYDSSFKRYTTNKEEIIFLQEFTKISKESPEIVIDDGMGCPFYSHQIGFFNVKVDNSLISSLMENFEKALLTDFNTVIDEEYMQSNFPDNLLYFYELKKYIREDLKRLIYTVFNDGKYTHVTDKIANGFENYDPIYINEKTTVVLGVTKESLYKFSIYKTYDVDNIYIGLKYFIAQSEETVICGDVRLVNDVLLLIEQSNLTFESDIVYKISKNNGGQSLLILQCSELWAIICPMKTDKDVVISKEYAEIKSLGNTLKTFISDYSLFEEYNFSKLNPNNFEKMCYDLLIDMGFKNVILRGSTNMPDGGVDIEADEEIPTLFGLETRHWIFQCKHTKSQVDRKDISEIPDLLRDFKAYGYGIFYTGIFSPQTLDRIKNKDCTIKYWSKNELEILLSKNINTAIKYFGLNFS